MHDWKSRSKIEKHCYEWNELNRNTKSLEHVFMLYFLLCLFSRWSGMVTETSETPHITTAAEGKKAQTKTSTWNKQKASVAIFWLILWSKLSAISSSNDNSISLECSDLREWEEVYCIRIHSWVQSKLQTKGSNFWWNIQKGFQSTYKRNSVRYFWWADKIRSLSISVPYYV